MIVLDLKCDSDHYFEGWFAGLEAFQQQQQAGEIGCPVCDSKQITRVLSPVAIRRHTAPAEAPPAEPADPASVQEKWKQIVDFVQKNCEDVGTDFAKEALKIHYGAAEKRNIKGTSTTDEEKTLRDEGVEFFKIPVPKEGH
jgi:hypothetical protein